ncbi:MAG: TIGR03013 family PEP-CTERM/XrtA system glycosyltransferase [Magnetococcales bacterium]|nr:TIGR03013 family PEP-CTERM/XrtA system glycosyltransferase [Magnetococcales bacterium]
MAIIDTQPDHLGTLGVCLAWVVSLSLPAGKLIRIFRHYFSRWSLVLLVIEAVTATVAVYIGVSLRFSGLVHYDEIYGDMLFPKALFFAVTILTSLAATGRYQRLMEEGFSGEMLNVGLSFVIAIIAMSMGFYVFPDLFIGRGAFAYALVIAFLLLLSVRWFFFCHILDLNVLRRRVVVFGTGGNAKLVAETVALSGQSDCTILGYWPVPGQPDLIDKARILQDGDELPDFVVKNCVDEIVVAVDGPFPAIYMNDIQECKMRGVRIMDLLEFGERERHVINTDVMEVAWWILHSEGLHQKPWRGAIKKAFDIVISLILMCFAAPVMGLVALAILAESGWRGPIFYIQDRVGFGGRIISVRKFRSMRTDAEQDGVARWASDDDDRVTRVGWFIRKFRIDEMPQFFNVLRGEMSLVGPRPERPVFVDALKKKIPYYAERLRVKPGITGWAQILYGYGASEEDAAEKLKYDLYYVKNHSLFLDLLVLIHTVEVVLFGRSTTGPREHGQRFIPE